MIGDEAGAGRTRPAVILLVGVIACSTSVIFIKGSELPSSALAAGRLWVATVFLAPLFLRDRRWHADRFGRRELMRGLLPGFFLGIHLISWNVGARMTSAVNASLVVNMVPLATPFLLWGMTGERLNRREWGGTILGLIGIAVLTAPDVELSSDHFLGDAVCFGSMLLFAIYLVLARANRDLPSVFLYVVPLYATAAITCTLASLLLDTPTQLERPVFEAAMVIGLGLVPTVIGHSALNHAMTRFRGQVVPISNLAQPIFAGVMAFFILGEVPEAAFYLACALILGGAALALIGDSESP